jgi:hypothetical protein
MNGRSSKQRKILLRKHTVRGRLERIQGEERIQDGCSAVHGILLRLLSYIMSQC